MSCSVFQTARPREGGDPAWARNKPDSRFRGNERSYRARVTAMTTYWFKPKQFGYGATPVTWQGWAITAVSVVIIAAATLWLTTLTAVSPWFWVALLIDAGVIVAVLEISRRKTEGEWRWRWGSE